MNVQYIATSGNGLASAKHPEYTYAREQEWLLARDSYNGESAIKSRNQTYLPKPSGFSEAGGHPDDGLAAYEAYKFRASFPSIMGSTVAAALGIIHEREINIQMPAAMDYLRENADNEGTTLTDFHRRVTRGILVEGRHGVLADAPSDGGEPYLSGYGAARIINWDVDFYVLDETGMERNGFTWQKVDKQRVLTLQDGVYVQTIYAGAAENDVTPNIQGGGAMTVVPFVCGSAFDIGPSIETAPLIGVARASVDIYQLEADQRLQLYMSGQETLVAINGPAPTAVGAGVVHQMDGTAEITPDLRYVSPTCAGIDAHADKIRQKELVAMQAGARLFEAGGNSQESGDARRLRFRSETANLQTIAQSSCAIMERALRFVAMFKNLNPDEVVVTPPDGLLDSILAPLEAQQLWQVVQTGGMSWETYYRLLQRGGIADPDIDAETEYARASVRDLSEVEDF